MKRMLTRERHTRWEDLIFQADCADKIGASSITVDIDLLLEVDAYLKKLNQDLLDKTVIVGFGCNHNLPEPFYRPDLDEMTPEQMEQLKKLKEIFSDHCDYCGDVILDDQPTAKTGHGTYHVYCHGPATREIGRH